MTDTPRTRPAGGNRSGGRGTGAPRPRGRRRLRRPVLIVVALLLLAVVGVVAAALRGDDSGQAPAAVTVAGVDVSHMDAAQILAVTRRRARELLNERVVITRADKPIFRIATTRRELGRAPGSGPPSTRPSRRGASAAA